jgi:hypothetical protein
VSATSLFGPRTRGRRLTHHRLFADAADDLSSISAPADVETFHETLAAEMKEYSKTLGAPGLDAIDHLDEWERALSEIRAGGYNVKPGWGTCPAG